MIALDQRPMEEEETVQPLHYDNGTTRIERLITQFDPISLAEMEQVSLLNRMDTKYVMGISQLETALRQIMGQYRALSVNRISLNHYNTLYFDTDDFAFYRQHHNGLRSRHKVRIRQYTDSDLAFWEVKQKTNQNRTIKSRFQVLDSVIKKNEPVDDFIETNLSVDADDLEAKVWNTFQRITLVSKHHSERLTLDINLAFGWGDAYVTLPGITIAEVKQERLSQPSDFIRQMRQLGIRPNRFSKYCAGIYMLYDHVKINNFKSRIRLVNALIQKELAYEYAC